jgi:hypothetical protein
VSEQQPPRQTYVLKLQSPHGDDARRLRWLFKKLLRRSYFPGRIQPIEPVPQVVFAYPWS